MFGLTATQWISIAALVSTVGMGAIGGFLKRLDSRNTRQHAEAQQGRLALSNDIDEVKTLLIEHIVWHGQHPIHKKESAA